MVFVYIEEYADDIEATRYFDVLKCALHPLTEKACIYFLMIFEVREQSLEENETDGKVLKYREGHPMAPGGSWYM